MTGTPAKDAVKVKQRTRKKYGRNRASFAVVLHSALAVDRVTARLHKHRKNWYIEVMSTTRNPGGNEYVMVVYGEHLAHNQGNRWHDLARFIKGRADDVQHGITRLTSQPWEQLDCPKGHPHCVVPKHARR